MSVSDAEVYGNRARGSDGACCGLLLVVKGCRRLLGRILSARLLYLPIVPSMGAAVCYCC